jgi:hypothetical protein
LDPTSALRIGPSEVTVIGLLIMALITGMMGKWVFGFVYREGIAYRDARIISLEGEVSRWQEIAIRAIEGMDRSVSVAEKVASK